MESLETNVWDWSEIDRDTITMFTDGSCYPNPHGPGGWAVYAMYQDWVKEKSGHLRSTTNNQAELLGVLKALQMVKRGKPPILIITDSKYVLRAVTLWTPLWRRNGWLNSQGAEVANRELLQQIDATITMHRQVRDVKLAWTKGHSNANTPYAQANARVDFLAGNARKGLTV